MVAVIQRVGHSYDSPQWSVSQMMKRPTLVPGMVVQGVKDNLIADLLLRQGPGCVSGQCFDDERFSSGYGRLDGGRCSVGRSDSYCGYP
jgi:hypothetical protein